MGLRPEWLFDDPSRASVDVIWEQIRACWSHDPRERPAALTVFQSLNALVHGASQEIQETSKCADDDTFATTSIISLIAFQPRGNSSTSNYDPTKSPRARAEERLRHLSHLLKPESTTTGVGEGRTQKMEIFGQREGIAQTTEGIAPYLTSTPIPNGKILKKVIITIVSKDQGWSGYERHHETYEGSWTWFELSVGPLSGSERWRGEVVTNLHAHENFREHTVEISDKGLYAKAESGDVLTIWACAVHSGWVNTVKEAIIYCAVE